MKIILAINATDPETIEIITENEGRYGTRKKVWATFSYKMLPSELCEEIEDAYDGEIEATLELA